jgi:tetratricopeptide (TPR) repeat protein
VIHEGRLFEQPLPELLVKLRRSKATATVELGATLASPSVHIHVSEGLIHRVVVDGAIPASLVDALKALKAVDAGTLKLAQKRALKVEGLTVDRVLIEMGGVKPKMLAKARSRQIHADLSEVMMRLDKLRRFRIIPAQKIIGAGVEPAQLMAHLVLQDGQAKRTKNIVLELGAVETRDGISLDRLIERFDLNNEDIVILRLLSVPRRCDELLDLREGDPLRLARLLRAMRLLGMVVGTPLSRAKAVVPVELRRIRKTVETEAPKRRITLQDMPVPARDQKLLKEIDGLLDVDYFALFDLDTETTKKEVNQAFLNLAQTWHPDRVQGRHPRLIAAVTKLFARINNARDTLEDRVLRETYYAHLKQNSGRSFRTQELSPETSRLECQKATVLMRKKDFWSAALHLKRAARLDPKNKKVRALELLLQIRDPETDSKQRIHCLEEAGKEYPNESELVFERAMEHFNRRNFVMAEELLVETLDLRPHHREAERYLKLTKMRLEKPKEKTTKNKGFFGR